MGLACSQIRLLTLTARKADCESGISMGAMKKMALTREQSTLSQQYYSKLQSKQISYYDDGQYNKMNYGYLMGYGANYMPITGDTKALKEDNSMILTDYNGQVVMSSAYANAIISVLGASAMDGNGRGGTFSVDSIPAILAALIPGRTEAEFKSVMGKSDEAIESEYTAENVNTLTGESTGTTTQVDNSDTKKDLIQKLVDFITQFFQQQLHMVGQQNITKK